MGELARKPGCPQLPESPLELLTPRPGEGYSQTEKLIWPVMGVVSGVVSVAVGNSVMRRPLWAGIHVHFCTALVFGFALTLARDSIFAARAESDAVLKHYISLHPDDFPPYERKRWRDVYLRFYPVR